jgi:hypothetical protein
VYKLSADSERADSEQVDHQRAVADDELSNESSELMRDGFKAWILLLQLIEGPELIPGGQLAKSDLQPETPLVVPAIVSDGEVTKLLSLRTKRVEVIGPGGDVQLLYFEQPEMFAYLTGDDCSVGCLLVLFACLFVCLFVCYGCWGLWVPALEGETSLSAAGRCLDGPA